MELDLRQPLFGLSETLKLVPGLSQGTVQNWIARGVFDYRPDWLPEGEHGYGPSKTEKHKKARWSAAGVITLRFMVEAARYGIGPAESIVLAYEVLEELPSFLDRFEVSQISEGYREFIVEGDRMKTFRQACIRRADDGPFSVSVRERDMDFWALAGAINGVFSIVVEIDFLFLIALNAIIRLQTGRDPMSGEVEG